MNFGEGLSSDPNRGTLLNTAASFTHRMKKRGRPTKISGKMQASPVRARGSVVLGGLGTQAEITLVGRSRFEERRQSLRSMARYRKESGRDSKKENLD